MPIVSLLRTEEYDMGLLRRQVERHFALLDVRIPADAHVLIKPNLIMKAAPEAAATTHPLLVDAVLCRLREMGVQRVTIADSPGGIYTPAVLSSVYRRCGLEEVAARWGARLNMDVGSVTRIRAENLLCREFELISPVAEADYIINLCKVKTHGMMTYTGGAKNLFGCVPGLLKPALHYRFPDTEPFARMLVDLAELVRPALTIADGVYGMEGDGPTGGSPRYLGVTAAAVYAGLYEMDRILSAMIGLSPAQAFTVGESIARGLAHEHMDPALLAGDVELAGEVVPFALPRSRSLDFSQNAGPLGGLVRKLGPHLASRPVVRKRACIGCGKCAEICPAKTIRLEAGKALIDPAACIRCFCCHEVCPARAIEMKQPWIFSFGSRQKTEGETR